MARFERPGADECAPYYRQYLDLVPDGVTNILNHLKVQGQGTLTLMRSLDDKAGEARYAPGKWTVKEVVGHMIDTERVFAFRALRAVLQTLRDWIPLGELADLSAQLPMLVRGADDEARSLLRRTNFHAS